MPHRHTQLHTRGRHTHDHEPRSPTPSAHRQPGPHELQQHGTTERLPITVGMPSHPHVQVCSLNHTSLHTFPTAGTQTSRAVTKLCSCTRVAHPPGTPTPPPAVQKAGAETMTLLLPTPRLQEQQWGKVWTPQPTARPLPAPPSPTPSLCGHSLELTPPPNCSHTPMSGHCPHAPMHSKHTVCSPSCPSHIPQRGPTAPLYILLPMPYQQAPDNCTPRSPPHTHVCHACFPCGYKQVHTTLG